MRIPQGVVAARGQMWKEERVHTQHEREHLCWDTRMEKVVVRQLKKLQETYERFHLQSNWSSRTSSNSLLHFLATVSSPCEHNGEVRTRNPPACLFVFMCVQDLYGSREVTTTSVCAPSWHPSGALIDIICMAINQ